MFTRNLTWGVDHSGPVSFRNIRHKASDTQTAPSAAQNRTGAAGIAAGILAAGAGTAVVMWDSEEAAMLEFMSQSMFWRMKLKIGFLTLATFIAMC